LGEPAGEPECDLNPATAQWAQPLFARRFRKVLRDELGELEPLWQECADAQSDPDLAGTVSLHVVVERSGALTAELLYDESDEGLADRADLVECLEEASQAVAINLPEAGYESAAISMGIHFEDGAVAMTGDLSYSFLPETAEATRRLAVMERVAAIAKRCPEDKLAGLKELTEAWHLQARRGSNLALARHARRLYELLGARGAVAGGVRYRYAELLWLEAELLHGEGNAGPLWDQVAAAFDAAAASTDLSSKLADASRLAAGLARQRGAAAE
jgi:hypothetical protein